MKKEIALSSILFLCISCVSNSIWAMKPDGMELELYGEESSDEESTDEEEILRQEVDYVFGEDSKEYMIGEIRRLKKQCKISKLDRRLVKAVKRDNKKRVRELVEEGANICVKKYRPHFYEGDGYIDPGKRLVFSPIDWAIEKRRSGMVTLLVELGADITQRASWSVLHPLHRAVQDSNEMVQTLLLSPYGVPGVRKTKWHTMRRRLQQLLYGITYARRGKAPIPREIRPLICRFALQVDGPPNGPVNGPLIERFPLQFLRYLCGYNLVDRDQIVTAFTQRHLGILSQAFSGRIHHRAVGEIEPLADGVNRTLFDPDPARIRAHFGENIEGAYRSFLTTFTQNESNN